jgi:hypothetical protein
MNPRAGGLTRNEKSRGFIEPNHRARGVRGMGFRKAAFANRAGREVAF